MLRLRGAMASAASPICSLLLLLVLQLPPFAAALPKPPARYQYHTLRATPLSPEPTARVDAAAILGTSTDLTAVFDGIGNASAVELVLAHREAFAAPNATAPQLLAHRLARDAARADAISSAAAAGATNGTRAPRRRGGSGFAAPVLSGLSQGSGEYFAQVGVGTPPTPALLVLDTGSDVVWLQCAPCRHCYAQSGRVFDPRRSRSYATVPCAAPLCRRLDSGGCNKRRGSCLYQVAYGDGSITAGDLATETLSFARGARVPRVAIGCGHDNEGLFVAAAGLLGLGRGRLSLPTQVARRYGRSFSYCLVDRTSSLKPSSTRSSTLTFGAAALAGAGAGAGARVSFTPMVRNPRMSTFYYVRVAGFSVGGARVRGVSERDLRLDPATGRGGVILDSGTSVTRLARPVYAAVRDAFRAAAAAAGGLRPSPGGFSLFDTCYDLGRRRVVKVPTLSVHLAGGAAVALPPENYLIPVDTRGTFCFALAGTDGGVSILGNIQQQGFRVVFDGDAQRVGLVPKSC
ncbi:aspartyl protease family protein 2 [Setaria italica]|uniref:Peptidase A1 domain-containing protein n=2 Tax=Setaria italica TaxID=4555 RepID=K3Z5F4_SETIT|nr:aspartyl protease family protein 2 [Setaria italica]